MAPAAALTARPPPTPSRKTARQTTKNSAYYEAGVQGRKTGITIQDTGRRDENGFEPLDAIFSSPEKSPAKTQAFVVVMNGLQSSGSMDGVHGSSAPEQGDVPSARRRSMRNSLLPPPKARSPMKTSLGSSPQRHPSLAPHQSSAARPSLGSPLRAKHVASVRRRLDFSEQRVPSVEASPAKANGYIARAVAVGIENVEPPSSVGGNDGLGERGIEESIHFLLQGGDDDDALPPSTSEPVVHNHNHTPPLPTARAKKGKGKAPTTAGKTAAQSSAQSTPNPTDSLKRKRGRPPTKRTSLLAAAQQTAPPPSPPPRRREQPALAAAPKTSFNPPTAPLTAFDETVIDPSLLSLSLRHDDDDDNTMAGALPPPDDEEEADASLSIETAEPVSMVPPPKPVPKKRGKMAVHRDQGVESGAGGGEEQRRPAKRARSASVPAPARAASKAPKAGDANKRVKTAAAATSRAKAGVQDGGDAEADIVAPTYSRAASTASSRSRAASRGVSRARTLQILRQGTPMDEPGTVTTRSGRTSVKPVSYWCNERINRDVDGTIRDIIRQETVEVDEGRVRGKRNGNGKKGPKVGRGEGDGDEDEVVEEWEEEGGVLTGLVREWDEEYNMTLEDEHVEKEIAFAASSIRPGEVVGQSFGYAKVVSLPFFGAGIVDVPAGGFKSAKNARRMQMVFFVHTGKVLVTVGDVEFYISKGGVWTVPRGNFYSIENRGTKPSRIFFSQGQDTGSAVAMAGDAGR